MKLGHRRVGSPQSALGTQAFGVQLRRASVRSPDLLTTTTSQKLQRRIANSRGIAPDASLVSPTQSSAEELKLQDAAKTEAAAIDSRETVGVVVTKRKYRRHPKVFSCLGNEAKAPLTSWLAG